MRKLFTWCSATLMALSLVACGGEDGGAPSQPDGGDNGGNTVVISELQVTPANSRIPVGFEQQLTAQAHLSDGTVSDVTTSPSMSWSSSDASIATVDNKGLVTGVKAGTAVMKASGSNASGQRFEATAEVEVTNATVTGLQVTPATASVPIGFTQEYVATALLSDGSTLDVTQLTGLTWRSSDATTASISNDGVTKGLATGVKPGSVTITASGSANGQQFSESAELTVTNATPTQLVVTPATASVPMGLSQQYQATLTFSDNTARDVTHEPALSWISSNTAVATISNADADKGLATGVTAGTATITAAGNANGQSFTASAELTVTNATVTALQVTPATASVPAGLTQPFTALATLSDGSTLDVTTDPALSWSSSDDTIATISSTDGDKGLATGVKTGVVTITAFGTAASGQTFTATAELTVTSATPTQLVVTPATVSTPAGFTQQFLATLTLSDGTTRDVTHEPALSWSSSDTAIATISNSTDKGLATGVMTGTVTITAAGNANGQSFTATAELTVTNTTITALQVTPATTTLPVGLTQPFTALATLSDGTTRDVTTDPALSWSSSDIAIATISNSTDKGLATGVTPGIVTITASGNAGSTPFSATAELTVIDAMVTELAITPLNASVPVGSTVQFQAMATLSDGGTLDVTEDASINWISDTPSVATISNVAGSRGEATGLVEGGAQITATMSGVTSPAAQLAVVPVSPGGPIVVEPRQNQIASLQITPEEFAFWNSTGINTAEGQAALKELTAVVYGQFQDEFDFITVVMNNEEVPFRMPTGEYTHVRNDVTGIGLSLFDYTADFHSAGKLQGISFLYKKKYLSTSTYGPILHEMAHRWANWVVPSSYAGHWGQELGIVGQLNDVSVNFADIELYLMGLMAASEMTDPASLSAYDLIPADQKPRVPDAAGAQKEFRTLLLILSDRPLTVTEIQDYNDGATLLARTDNPSQQGTNFHKMTGGRGTLVIGGLDTLQKP